MAKDGKDSRRWSMTKRQSNGTRSRRHARQKFLKATDRNPELVGEVANSRFEFLPQPTKTTFEDWKQPDPLCSPLRIMRDWNDDAIRAVWKASGIDVGTHINFQLRRASDLSARELDVCEAIVAHTSKADYEASSIGWDVNNKMLEMSDPQMMYILVRSSTETFAAAVPSSIIGFISFKIDKDDPPHATRDVLYIFEVHIGEKFRGKGLAKFLIFTVEAMASTISVAKTMLTVFNSNPGAINAYKKLGYIKDQASPPDREIRGKTFKADYMIMSKWWPNEDLHWQI